MQATVIKIDQYEERIYVRVRRASRTEQLDLFRARHLLNELKVGQKIEVTRESNSPYLYYIA
jgi:hypothetical protein